MALAGETTTQGGDDEATRRPQEHLVRQPKVVAGTQLVGMTRRADVARTRAPDKVKSLVAAISQD